MMKNEIKGIDLLSNIEKVKIDELAETWYGTTGCCNLYISDSSKYVALWYRNDERKILSSSCCFNYIRHNLFGYHLQIDGSASLHFAEMQDLLINSKVNLLTCPVPEESVSEYKLPWWKVHFLVSESDWILKLPDNSVDYFAGLGKTSRKHFKSYLQKFESKFNSEIKILVSSAITYENIVELVALHKLRRMESGKEFTFIQEKVEKRYELAMQNGIFCGRWVNGRLIGGTLNFKHKTNAYLSLVAHDPAYDNYHLGIICLLDSIQYFISEGFNNYNLHYRFSPFKTRLGAKKHDYFKMVVFRNIFIAIYWNIKRLIINMLYRLKNNNLFQNR